MTIKKKDTIKKKASKKTSDKSEHWSETAVTEPAVRKLLSEHKLLTAAGRYSKTNKALILKNASGTALIIFEEKNAGAIELMLFINHSLISTEELLRDALMSAKSKWPGSKASASIKNSQENSQSYKNALINSGWNEKSAGKILSRLEIKL